MAAHTDRRVVFTWNEVTGAVGDSVTVLPIVVAVAVLTDLSLALMLVWFGLAQIVWGLYFGVPISIEPMKALAALVIAGSISSGELLIAGLLLGGILLAIGLTRTIDRLQWLLGPPVVRGIQFGVALVLIETGIDLGLGDPLLAGLAILIAVPMLLRRYVNASALVVVVVGAIVAVFAGGVPTPAIPPMEAMWLFDRSDLTLAAAEATVAQLAMTIGNAALAASFLLGEYFDRDISPDQLSTSMGAMNLVAIPFGGFPMCHGSGGIAGKYVFGARTAGANVILGIGYLLLAVVGVGLVVAYPLAMLGVILLIVAGQLGYSSLQATDDVWLVVAIGVVGLFVNLGLAFVLGVLAYLVLERVE